MNPETLPWRGSGWPLSEHLRLEIAHAHHVGHTAGDPPPLGPEDLVPGCGCPSCCTLAGGGGPEDAQLAEDLVRFLADFPPGERPDAVEEVRAEREALGYDWRLPSSGVLVILAARAPGALREPLANGRKRPGPTDREQRLPVEEARSAEIVALCSRLGLGEPVRRGREYAVRCPFHDDEHPSMRLNPEKGTWYCDPCAQGGDGIALAMRVRALSFAEAVRVIAG